MVQRYPSSSKPIKLERPPAPRSVVNAVRLMYAGAAVSAVSLVLFLVFSSALKPSIRRQYPHWTASQVNRAFDGFLAVSIIEAVIGIGLWLLMAWANNQGKNWARITATILFAIDTLLTLVTFSKGPQTPVGLVLPSLTWLIGAGAIWLLWRKENNDFYVTREI
jgi:hypothetical protein